jgi:hypothetical protein
MVSKTNFKAISVVVFSACLSVTSHFCLLMVCVSFNKFIDIVVSQLLVARQLFRFLFVETDLYTIQFVKNQLKSLKIYFTICFGLKWPSSRVRYQVLRRYNYFSCILRRSRQSSHTRLIPTDALSPAISLSWTTILITIIMMSVVFLEVEPWKSCVNRRFGGSYRLHSEQKEFAIEKQRSSLLNPRLQNLLPWRWRRHIPPKSWFSETLHVATSQKMALFIATALETSNPNTITL